MNHKRVYTIIGIILIFIIWLLISLIIDEQKLIFPGPIETIAYLKFLLVKKSTYTSILITIMKTLIGFLISLFFALILGIISGLNKIIKKHQSKNNLTINTTDKIKLVLNPIITVFKAVPTASVLFLFLVIAGVKNAPIFVVILISLPVLYDSVVGGMENIPKELKDVTRLESGKKLSTILKIYIPLAANYIIVGITSAFGLAYKVEIMSEILTGDTTLGNGIGVAIHNVQINEVNMTPIFAWTLIAIILLLIINFLANLIKTKMKKNIL